MLREMRKTASSWLIKILLGTIVLAFIFMGVGSYRSEKANRVATVNGQSVSLNEYREAYRNLVERMRQQFGNNLNADMLKMLNVKQQAIDGLVDQKLLLQEAADMQLQVTDDELQKSIREMAVFKNEGVFDAQRYKTLLSRVMMSPEQFEMKQREMMLSDKVRSLVAENAKVSEMEAREWYSMENTEVSIEAVLFSPSRYTEIQPSEDEVKAYFEKNKEKYKTEPECKVRYVRFGPESYREAVSISAAEIADYYNANREQFVTPKTVEARHILIKIDEGADQALVDDAKKRAEDVRKKSLEKGADFAELAKKYSEGPTKDKGGYLGAFRREAMVKPFSDKAFSMKAGEISEPVRTRFGWHVIKVEKVNEAKTDSLEEATAKIRKQLTDDKAKNIAYDEAESFFEITVDGEDFSAAAEARQLKVETTDYFTEKGPTGIPQSRKFAEAAFELPQMEISDILDLGNTYYLLQVLEKVPEQTAKFENVSEQVSKDLIAMLQDEKASAEAEKFLKSMQEGETLAEMAKQLELEVIRTGFFKKNGSIPNIGYEKAVSEAAFELSPEKRWPEKVIKGQKGYYVIRFDEKKLPDSADFEKERQQIVDRLLEQKKRGLFEDWLARLREGSEIVIQEDML